MEGKGRARGGNRRREGGRKGEGEREWGGRVRGRVSEGYEWMG